MDSLARCPSPQHNIQVAHNRRQMFRQDGPGAAGAYRRYVNRGEPSEGYRQNIERAPNQRQAQVNQRRWRGGRGHRPQFGWRDKPQFDRRRDDDFNQPELNVRTQHMVQTPQGTAVEQRGNKRKGKNRQPQNNLPTEAQLDLNRARKNFEEVLQTSFVTKASPEKENISTNMSNNSWNSEIQKENKMCNGFNTAEKNKIITNGATCSPKKQPRYARMKPDSKMPTGWKLSNRRNDKANNAADSLELLLKNWTIKPDKLHNGQKPFCEKTSVNSATASSEKHLSNSRTRLDNENVSEWKFLTRPELGTNGREPPNHRRVKPANKPSDGREPDCLKNIDMALAPCSKENSRLLTCKKPSITDGWDIEGAAECTTLPNMKPRPQIHHLGKTSTSSHDCESESSESSNFDEGVKVGKTNAQSNKQTNETMKMNGETDSRKYLRLPSRARMNLETRGTKKREELEKILPKVVLNTNATFPEQAADMVRQLEMTDQQRSTIPYVLNDVANVYRPVLPGVQPTLYGSSFTNICFKTSDLDVHLNSAIRKPDYNFVKERGGILYGSRLFRNTIKVSKARVPLMKTTHVSGFDLDISATSEQAVYNSHLVKFIISRDPRIRTLLMLISYWTKWNNISGMNLFSRYSIVLMVLFYLQQLDPPLVPPMKELLDCVSPTDWPYALKHSLDQYPLPKNNMSITDLFKGFFFFYDKKDFSSVVISPYLGREIPVSDFENFELLTDELDIYKQQVALGNNTMQIGIITVQDPIELNVNTARHVFGRLLKVFKVSINKFVTNTSRLPESKWLHTIITDDPMTVEKSRRPFIVNIKYPKFKEDWFETLIEDFHKICKLVSINIETVEQNKIQKLDSEGFKKGNILSFFRLDTTSNVFTKKYRTVLREFLNGLFSSATFGKKVEEIKSNFPNKVSFEAIVKVKLGDDEKQPDLAHVQFLFIDKNDSNFNNAFSSIIDEFNRSLNKFFAIIRKEQGCEFKIESKQENASKSENRKKGKGGKSDCTSVSKDIKQENPTENSK